MKAIELITKECERQVSELGYTPEHDDEHAIGELAMAASCYTMLPIYRPSEIAPLGWPWSNSGPMDGFKPSPNNRIRELVKAGALIVKEIERLQRLEGESDGFLYKKEYVDDQDAYGYDVKSKVPKCGDCNCVYSCKNDVFA